jgi:hypothetical protein
MGKELIRDTRVTVDLEASYLLKGNENECEILDISNTGMQIKSRQVLIPGDLLQIKMTLNSQSVSFFAIVRNGKETVYGVEFEEMHPRVRDIIDEYLGKLFDKHNHKPREKIDLLQEIMGNLKNQDH